MTEEKRQPATTEQLVRALVVEMRKNTAAMASLAEALNGLVQVFLSEQHAPPDSEEAVPKKPTYMCDEDN